MIKKIISVFIIFMGFQISVQAVENKTVLNVRTENSYILPLKFRPMDIKISNPDIVKVDAVTNIEEADSSLLITTIKEGISYVTFKQKEQEITLKLLIDNIAEEDEELLKLDLPQGCKK